MFPEYHYRQGFEQLRGEYSDETVDEWVDNVIGKQPVKATHGGLWIGDIPTIVDDILTSSRRYQVDISIRPESSLGRTGEYTVEWQYLDWDDRHDEWKPVNEIDHRQR